MTHLTPEEIAEKVYPDLVNYEAEGWTIEHYTQMKDELTQLITTLQKETWDEACIEQREKCAHQLHKVQPKNLEEAIDIVNFCPVKLFNPEK